MLVIGWVAEWCVAIVIADVVGRYLSTVEGELFAVCCCSFMNRTGDCFFFVVAVVVCCQLLLIVYLVPGQRLTGGERRAGGEGGNRRLRWRCSRVLCAFPEKSRRWS